MKKITNTLLFSLLLSSLFSQNQDCAEALELFTKDSITVTDLQGIGETNEFFENLCITGENIESNSSWYTFTPIKTGSFYFTIKPIDPTNDLDFYMFTTLTGFCNGLESIRCNASSCVTENGHTGLSPDDPDEYEDLNCEEGENLFSSEVLVNEDETYYLMVNNFTGNAGFVITFCGTALLGPADEECPRETTSIDEFSEKEIAVYPNPSSGTINIPSYNEIDFLELVTIHGTIQQTKTDIKEKMALDVNPGMYYIRMKLKTGKIAVTPLVVSH